MTRRFFRNASFLAVGEVVMRLKSLVLIPLLTHYFGTVNYGAWAQVAVMVGLVPPLIMLGTDTAISRFIPGKPLAEQASWFAGWLLGLAALSCICCSVLYLARVPLAVIFFGTARSYGSLIPLAAATIFITVLIQVVRTWFRVQNQAAWYSVVTIFQALIGALAVTLVLVTHKGVYQAVLYDAVGEALLTAALLARIFMRVGLTTPDFSALRPLVGFGLPLLPAAYAIWALNWLDRVFLVKYTSLAAIGIYSLSYSFGLLVVQTVANPIWTLFPNSAAELWNQNRKEELQHLFDRCTGAMLLLVLPAIGGSAVIAGGVLRLLAPSSFAAGAPVVPIVLAAYGATMVASYYETLFWLINRPSLSTLSVALAFVVNLALNFILIPPFGYIGAAIATAVAFGAQLLFSIVLSLRMGLVRSSVRMPSLVAFATILMTAVMLGLRIVLGDLHPVNLLVVAAGGALAYLIFIIGLGIVPARRIRDEIRLFLPSRTVERCPEPGASRAVGS